MSIMVISKNKEIIEKDVNTLIQFCNRYGHSSFTVEIVENNYNEWLRLNELSYCMRYKEEITEIPYIKWAALGKQKYSNYCQLLKRLQCIRYNIEFDDYKPTYQEQECINSLTAIIGELKDWIINQLEDYKEAAYN